MDELFDYILLDNLFIWNGWIIWLYIIG